MTNAPADLLGLRATLEILTSLGPDELGVVGNGAHQRTGGYHEGKDTLQANGLWTGDYSVRLARDRAGCTTSASAMDVGAGWKQGRATWLRWNNLLANALRSGDPALAAVRAINYSPDGTLRWRLDREAGWKTASTSDTVTIHTHIEWYRDTEARRSASIARIVALVQQAITGRVVVASAPTPKQEDHMYFLALSDPPASQYYLCDGARSYPVGLADITVLRRLRDAGYVQIASDPAHPTLGSTLEFPVQHWTPSFGAVQGQPAPVDVLALATALGPLLAAGVTTEQVVAALESDAGQVALVQAANTAEDS